jgi:uncharacterized protein (TIGR03437 family)
MKYVIVLLGLTTAALAQQHSTVPVVLVDGYDYLGKCGAPRNEATDFGQLAQLLRLDGNQKVLYYDFCGQPGVGHPQYSIPMAAAMGTLAQFLAKNFPDSSSPIDVIAYDAGGLFVRYYLSGNVNLQYGSGPLLPYAGTNALKTPIRKLVMIGTPNFGVIDGSLTPTAANPVAGFPEVSLMESGFLWELNTWNQGGDDLRGADAISIAGNGGTPMQAFDGTVSVNSASIGFAYPDGSGDLRTRVLNGYCHGSFMLSTSVSCLSGTIAGVTGRDHPTYQIVRSFLDDRWDWTSIGLSASAASKTGGIFASLGGTMWDTPPALVNSILPLIGLQPNMQYGDFLPVIPTSISYTRGAVWDTDLAYAAQGWITFKETFSVTIQPGTFQRIIHDDGALHTPSTLIDVWGITTMGGVTPGPRSLAPDSLVTIHGQNLTWGTPAPTVTKPGVNYAQDAPTMSASSGSTWPTQMAGTSVLLWSGPLNAASGPQQGTTIYNCTLGFVSPTQINAKLPAGLAPGAYWLEVDTPLHDSVSGATQRARSINNIVVEPIAPALLHNGDAIVQALHDSDYMWVSKSYPAAIGEAISLYGTGLGAVTGDQQIASSTPQVFIDGQQATVSFAGRSPGNPGLDQIDVTVPSGVRTGAWAPVVIVSSALECPNPVLPKQCSTITRTSNTALLPIN